MEIARTFLLSQLLRLRFKNMNKLVPDHFPLRLWIFDAGEFG